MEKMEDDALSGKIKKVAGTRNISGVSGTLNASNASYTPRVTRNVHTNMRRKNVNLNGMPIVVIVLVVICSVFAYKSVSVLQEKKQLEKTYAELTEELDEEKERTEELVAKSEYMMSKEYIEYIARTKLGLVYEDEIIFVPEDSE